MNDASSSLLQSTEWSMLVREDVQRWLEQAVIGLNLCPFAKAVVAHDRLRMRVSDAREPHAVLQVLKEELKLLASTPMKQVETTLLIAPWVCPDFLDFNDLVGEAQEVLEALDLDGELQIADFHPRYQFAGTDVDDPGNLTNRAPYPILHLLREESIDRAVASTPDAATIYERNIALLEAMGQAGWDGLGIRTRCPFHDAPKDET
jgi:hypothetical protein